MVNQDKSELRKYIRELKKQYPFELKKQKSENIFNRLEKHDFFLDAKVVMLYWSMKDEVFTHDFVNKWVNKKTMILPAVKGDELELRKFEGLENMIIGESFGIAEPAGEAFKNTDEIDLIIVPGVAFDKQNNRLGRGKAYYDKLLKTSNAKKIGLCFDFQLLDSVPVDEHDIKMDLVISDSEQ